MANDLTDTISFHDYYAIRIFLSSPYVNTDLDEPYVWRLKKAVYSLAIRQYNSFQPFRKKQMMILYCVHLKNVHKIIRISRYKTISINGFLYCNEDSSEWDYLYETSSKINKFQEPISITYYKLILNKPYLAIHVKNIVANSKFYIIIPKTKFIFIEEKFNLIDQSNINFVILKFRVQTVEGEWLSKVANEASYYEDKINGETMSKPYERLYCKN